MFRAEACLGAIDHPARSIILTQIHIAGLYESQNWYVLLFFLSFFFLRHCFYVYYVKMQNVCSHASQTDTVSQPDIYCKPFYFCGAKFLRLRPILAFASVIFLRQKAAQYSSESGKS